MRAFFTSAFLLSSLSLTAFADDTDALSPSPIPPYLGNIPLTSDAPLSLLAVPTSVMPGSVMESSAATQIPTPYGANSLCAQACPTAAPSSAVPTGPVDASSVLSAASSLLALFPQLVSQAPPSSCAQQSAVPTGGMTFPLVFGGQTIGYGYGIVTQTALTGAMSSLPASIVSSPYQASDVSSNVPVAPTSARYYPTSYPTGITPYYPTGAVAGTAATSGYLRGTGNSSIPTSRTTNSPAIMTGKAAVSSIDSQLVAMTLALILFASLGASKMFSI